NALFSGEALYGQGALERCAEAGPLDRGSAIRAAYGCGVAEPVRRTAGRGGLRGPFAAPRADGSPCRPTRLAERTRRRGRPSSHLLAAPPQGDLPPEGGLRRQLAARRGPPPGVVRTFPALPPPHQGTEGRR